MSSGAVEHYNTQHVSHSNCTVHLQACYWYFTVTVQVQRLMTLQHDNKILCTYIYFTFSKQHCNLRYFNMTVIWREYFLGEVIVWRRNWGATCVVTPLRVLSDDDAAAGKSRERQSAHKTDAKHLNALICGNRGRQRDTDRERQRDRHTDTQADRETQTEGDRETDTQTDMDSWTGKTWGICDDQLILHLRTPLWRLVVALCDLYGRLFVPQRLSYRVVQSYIVCASVWNSLLTLA